MHNDRSFAQQTDAIRENNWARLWCTNGAAHLNAENIIGLSAVWRDIQATLTQVGQCTSNYSDKGASTVAVLISDFEALDKSLSLKRHTMDPGQREAGIHECRDLMKRINIARESGYDSRA